MVDFPEVSVWLVEWNYFGRLVRFLFNHVQLQNSVLEYILI